MASEGDSMPPVSPMVADERDDVESRGGGTGRSGGEGEGEGKRGYEDTRTK